MTQDDDPFANVRVRGTKTAGSIITAGRYRLPNLDGTHKKGGWQRVSNLVSAYSDQFGLRMWEIEQTLRGIQADKSLYTELLDTVWPEEREARKVFTEEFIERCKRVAGGTVGSDFGNQRHGAVEVDHGGLPTHQFSADTRRHLSLYRAALARHGLVAQEGMQERRVLLEELDACGTLDNIVNDMVGDLKTQKRFWTFLEIGAQLACYAHGDAMWDVAAGRWVDMPKVRQDVAVVFWMPRVTEDGEPRVDVYEVDIAAGWETAKRAREVVLDRQSAKRRGWLRPAPPVTETERYAALYAAVDSLAEGRALSVEVRRRGLWSEALADSARQAFDRLLLTKNVVS